MMAREKITGVPMTQSEIDSARRTRGSEARSSIINGHRGPTTIDLPGGYSADIFMKDAYRTKERELAEELKRLIAEAQVWSPEVADQMVLGALDTCDASNASWIGFRKSDAPMITPNAPIGVYNGAAWQEVEKIATPRVLRDTLWMKFRVFDPETQGRHFGRLAMQLALSVHPEADSIAHKTGSARAVHAWLESGVFLPGRRFPRDVTFDKDSQMAQMLIWLWDRHHINGEIPSLITGVSKYDYAEPNGADPEDKKYPHVMAVRAWMTDVLKFRSKRRDTLYQIGELK